MADIDDTNMLGRVVHYAVDVVLVSTVLAGVKKSCGFAYVSMLIICIPMVPSQHKKIDQRQVELPTLLHDLLQRNFLG